MAVGIITGSGTYALPGFEQEERLTVETPYGGTEVTRGRFGGASVLHISRHGEPTAVATLAELLGRSARVFADVLEAAVPRIVAEVPAGAGTMFRFDLPVAGGVDE